MPAPVGTYATHVLFVCWTAAVSPVHMYIILSPEPWCNNSRQDLLSSLYPILFVCFCLSRLVLDDVSAPLWRLGDSYITRFHNHFSADISHVSGVFPCAH